MLITSIENNTFDFYSNRPYGFTTYNGTLYFSAGTRYSGRELWSNNSDHNELKMMRDINPGSSASFPAKLTVLNGKL